MPFAYNADHVAHLIDSGKDAITEAVEKLVDDLIDNGAIRISRNWSALTERAAIIKAARDVALLSVLTCDWSNLDDETRWLFVTRTEAKAAERVAAQ